MNKKADNERADKFIKVRITEQLKQEFMEACKANGHKATDIFIDAINNYLKYNRK